MSASQQSSVRNRLLAILPPDDFAALQPHLEPVAFELRQVLIEPGKPVEHVYFVETGYTSVTTDGGGSKIEVGIIGREGIVGVFVTLGVRTIPLEFFVQAAGEGLRISADRLEAVLDEQPAARRLLLRYAHALNIQTSGTAFANAEHTVEARLARWLLMCHDRLDGDDIPITHDFMSMMLGIRRAGVTTATHVLEGNGLIRAKRGVITVLNREKLEELADNSYGLPEAEYERLIAGR
ncbi:MAG TPA: Crp/Fnr family transcriptional regulator [Salinarimonas sp.]|nr:Crp/Fnr family transcriptional regulator [Salinarimonas sp.]